MNPKFSQNHGCPLYFYILTAGLSYRVPPTQLIAIPTFCGLFADDIALQGAVFKQLWKNNHHSKISNFFCPSSTEATEMIASLKKKLQGK